MAHEIDIKQYVQKSVIWQNVYVHTHEFLD